MKRYNGNFLGVRQQHSYRLHGIIDDILIENPQVTRFIEVGTGHGALSVILGLQALMRGSHLLTFDPQMREGLFLLKPIFERLSIEFQLFSCFSIKSKVRMRNYIENNPCFFFCDGADKPKEFNTFSEFLPKDSIICAHDYTIEIQDKDIDNTHLTPIHKVCWADRDVLTCFWKRK